jgi:hypothetical protein
MTNDDYRNRMVAIDPATQAALVWQYGVTDTPGTAPGMLNTPDGFDLLLPNGTTDTPGHRIDLEPRRFRALERRIAQMAPGA